MSKHMLEEPNDKEIGLELLTLIVFPDLDPDGWIVEVKDTTQCVDCVANDNYRQRANIMIFYHEQEEEGYCLDCIQHRAEFIRLMDKDD